MCIRDRINTGNKKSVNALMRKITAVSVMVGLASAALLYMFSDIISLYWIKDCLLYTSNYFLGRNKHGKNNKPNKF